MPQPPRPIEFEDIPKTLLEIEQLVHTMQRDIHPDAIQPEDVAYLTQSLPTIKDLLQSAYWTVCGW